MKPTNQKIHPIVPSISIPGITKPILSINNFEFEPGQFLVLSPAGHSPAEEHDRCEDHSGAFAPSGFRCHPLSFLTAKSALRPKKPSLKSDVTGGDYLPTTASLSATSVACTACSTAVASGNDAENPGFSCENHEWTVQSQAATACPRFQAAGPRQPAHWPKRQEVYIEYGKAANQRQNEVYPGVSEIQT